MKLKLGMYCYEKFPLFFQFDLSYVRILRVKEFRFREVSRLPRISEEEGRERERSVDNLMQVDTHIFTLTLFIIHMHILFPSTCTHRHSYLHTRAHRCIHTLIHIYTYTHCLQDDDEVTNQRGGSIRRREQQERGGRARGGDSQTNEPHPLTSRWNIDGNEIPHSDIELR